MFDKDTEEPWDGVFNLINEEVSKVKIGTLNKNRVA